MWWLVWKKRSVWHGIRWQSVQSNIYNKCIKLICLFHSYYFILFYFFWFAFTIAGFYFFFLQMKNSVGVEHTRTYWITMRWYTKMCCARSALFKDWFRQARYICIYINWICIYSVIWLTLIRIYISYEKMKKRKKKDRKGEKYIVCGKIDRTQNICECTYNGLSPCFVNLHHDGYKTYTVFNVTMQLHCFLSAGFFFSLVSVILTFIEWNSILFRAQNAHKQNLVTLVLRNGFFSQIFPEIILSIDLQWRIIHKNNV